MVALAGLLRLQHAPQEEVWKVALLRMGLRPRFPLAEPFLKVSVVLLVLQLKLS
jgi:hypothetical protein